MKTAAFSAIFVTLLTTLTSAAPTARTNTITFQLANDQSGAYANVAVPADGVPMVQRVHYGAQKYFLIVSVPVGTFLHGGVLLCDVKVRSKKSGLAVKE